jgi:hypothetical protein
MDECYKWQNLCPPAPPIPSGRRGLPLPRAGGGTGTLRARRTQYELQQTENGEGESSDTKKAASRERTGLESEEAHGSAPAARREEPSRLPMDGFVGGRRCSASPVLLAEGGVSLHFLAFSLHFLGWKTAGLMFGSFTRALLFRLSVLFGPL